MPADRRLIRGLCGLALVLLASGAATAQPRSGLGQLFTDHAVLQRGQPIRIWGDALPGEEVRLSFAGRTAEARGDLLGRWRVELPAMPAGGPHEIEARFGSGVLARAKEVMVGDVWLCSGQSNMELPVSRALDSDSQVQSANDPQLRVMTIPHLSAPDPRATFAQPIAWRPVSPATVGDFSAACYFMARELRRSQNVAIGAISASWGGTPIRAWLDERAAAATGGNDYALVQLHRRDPARANRVFGDAWADWWRKESGDAPGAEPWTDSRRLRWVPVPAMAYWEQWGDPRFAEFNGMLWFRKRFALTAEQAGQGGTLSLGVIDELDQVFVNGMAVGGRYSWEAERNYPVPASALRAGDNEIIANISDGGGAGGFQGPADKLRLKLADGTDVPLGSGWSYSVVQKPPGSAPRTPWDEAMGLTAIYNGMIAPLQDYGFKGAAWYQGESDVGVPGSYAQRLAAMMAGWRRQFRQPNLPFLIVGLANFGPHATRPVASGWAELREQQRIATVQDPYAELVVAMDLGERLDIHPANKQEVGRRLARAARSLAYDEQVSPGPQVSRAYRRGGSIFVEFTGVTGSLQTWSGNRALAFELCAETQQSCRFAEATADGNSVRLAADGARVTRVRYAWADTPVTNLYDEVPLPVGPFEITVR